MPDPNAMVLRRVLPLALLLGAAAATSGCAYTMGELDQGSPTASASPASDGSATSSLPIKPATYVIDTTDAPRPAATAPTPAEGTTVGYPNMNAIPEPPKSKLLTQEEKAKVIADLEALAKSQGAAVEKSRKAATVKCDDAVRNALDPEAKLKSEATGQGC